MKAELKPEELRVGNWISYVEPSTKELKQFQVYAETFCDIESTQLDPLPIELSEEWLLKAGWRFYNGRTTGDMTMDTPCKLDLDFRHKKIMIKSHYEDCSMYQPLNHIKYVHQLQNLFYALTGNELIFNHG